VLVIAAVAGGIGLAIVYQSDRNHEEQLSAARAELDRLNSQLRSLQTQNTDLAYKAEHPTLGTWNDCGGSCTIEANAYRVGVVPDTFTSHIAYTSDYAVDVAVLSLTEYETFKGCPTNHYSTSPQFSLMASCLALATSNPASQFRSGTSVSFDFHDAEGCASYVMVMVSNTRNTATLHPNVTVTYNPASHPTGVCAH
jgi:hypothetical protein